jgi:hypothetical protein
MKMTQKRRRKKRLQTLSERKAGMRRVPTRASPNLPTLSSRPTHSSRNLKISI